MKSIVLIILLVSYVSLASATNKVIYGDDNRLDYYEVTNPLIKKIAISTAAMISSSSLKTEGEIVHINAGTLSGYGVCSGERFVNQLMAANCSGFLVAKDVLVTAGHCIEDMGDCRSSKWVFDFAINEQGGNAKSVPATSVYSCKKIIERELDNSTGNDFAVIQLDRKVNDREPLKFRTEGIITQGTGLIVIGHPTGIPMKIADGAAVRSVNDFYFVANLDTFGGNSGSAVFNADTGVVEGILVRGEQDYSYSSARGCYVPKQCLNSGCRGEDVTRITNLGLEGLL